MNRRDIFKLFGSAAAIPAVKSIEMLEMMKPDDVLILKVKGRNLDTMREIKALCESKLPGRKVLVIDETIDFEVLRKA